MSDDRNEELRGRIAELRKLANEHKREVCSHNLWCQHQLLAATLAFHADFLDAQRTDIKAGDA